ncbi:MAG: glycoside hydrolase [Bacteroidales bacterium]|nr:glycoside hydrolase [Bacteroidales bacterium]
MKTRHIIALALAALTLAACGPRKTVIKLLPGERVWAGKVANGIDLPVEDTLVIDMHNNFGNQLAPLIMTSAGRYIWSDEPYTATVTADKIVITDAEAPLETAIVGENLQDAYRFCMRKFFPPQGGLPPREFFEVPQYNTWIEFQYDQNQAGITEYARNIVRNGFKPGILMLDDTWMEDYGKWEFHPGRFPNPKVFCDELHALGFKIMLWVVPYVSLDQYQLCEEIHHVPGNGFIQGPNGGDYPFCWWNGISGCIDFSDSASVAWFTGKLDHLMNEYGVDGFKFDAGDLDAWPDPASTVNKGGFSPQQLCYAWAALGDKYPYNEFRACWKHGGKPYVQRLHDKGHHFGALQRLIPEMMITGLFGWWYAAPDMIGGGSFASFLPGMPINQDLIVRSSQIHAMMPMMQFSVAPWRVLDAEHLAAVKKSVAIREQMLPLIVGLFEKTASTGEPVVAPLEYWFPNAGLADIIDEYMLGPDILVAPMVEEGFSRSVVLPAGHWTADDGSVYDGPCTVTIDVPLERIPRFTR